MGEALINGLSTLINFIPSLLGFLLVLLIGYLIAKGLSKLVGMALSKIGFGNLLQKAGLANVASRMNFDVGALIVKLVYYFVLLIALQFAFTAFGPNPVEQLLTDIIIFLPRLIVALILVIVAAWIARFVKDIVVSALSGRQFAPMLGNITYAVILALGVIAAVNQIGVATSITQPVLIAVLATASGILIVGVGGGLIQPMRSRWEDGLQSLQSQLEAPPAAGSQAAGSQVAGDYGQPQEPYGQHAQGEPSAEPYGQPTPPSDQGPSDPGPGYPQQPTN